MAPAPLQQCVQLRTAGPTITTCVDLISASLYTYRCKSSTSHSTTMCASPTITLCVDPKIAKAAPHTQGTTMCASPTITTCADPKSAKAAPHTVQQCAQVPL